VPQIRAATEHDLEVWLALRLKLWPDTSFAEHRGELHALRSAPDRFCGLLAFDDDGSLIGFAEASLRFDRVPGCGRPPVAFLEGIDVAPQQRRCGVARALCAAVERWAHSLCCNELGSDARIENIGSQRFHQAVGLTPTERVVFFRKELQ